MQLYVNIIVLASIYALIACGYVLIYRVSRVLNLAHGELMMLGAYLLLSVGSTFGGHPFMAMAAAVVLSACVVNAGLPVSDAQDDRRNGACGGAHHHRIGHLAARAGGFDLVGAGATSDQIARLHQCLVCIARRCARLDLRRITRSGERHRLWQFVLLPAVWPLGRADARRRTKSAAGSAARDQSARHLCTRLGPLDSHRFAGGHADGARTRGSTPP